MAENNPIESPFLKIVTSSRYRTAPQPTDTLYTVKRKYNLEIQNTEIFNKVKLSNKPDSDKVIEFPVGHPEEDTFKIEAEVPASVLLASVLDLVPPDKENDPTHLSPELKEVKLVFEYVNTLSTVYLMNNMINQKLSNFKMQFVEDIVIPFLMEIIPDIYVAKYNEPKRPELSQGSSSENFSKYLTDTHSHFINDLFVKLMTDFIGTASLYTSMSLHGILEKLTDSDIMNCFFQNPFYFDHYLNYALSPIALNLTYFHHRLITYQKDSYSKSTLPRVTYISFTGLYSQLDIDFITKFSDTAQVIILYDVKTGGPLFFPQGDYDEIDPKFTRDFILKENVILLPVETSGKPFKTLYSSDIYTIFKSIILPLLYTFNPEFVVLNHSYLFSKDADTPFYLEPRTLGKIIRMIAINSDFKIVVYPFKLPRKTPKELDEYINVMKEDMKKKFNNDESVRNMNEEAKKNFDNGVDQKIRDLESVYRYVFQTYGIDYDRKYFKDCYVVTIEAISLMKRYSKKYVPSVKKADNLLDYGFTENTHAHKINPYLGKTLALWTKVYKNHSQAAIFQTSLNQMSQLITNNLISYMIDQNKKYFSLFDFQQTSIYPLNTADRIDNYNLSDLRSKILVWIDETFVFINLAPKISLNQKDWSSYDISDNYILDKNSQYYVNYIDEKRYIEIYVFNAVQLSGMPQYRNIKIKFTVDQDFKEIKKNSDIKTVQYTDDSKKTVDTIELSLTPSKWLSVSELSNPAKGYAPNKDLEAHMLRCFYLKEMGIAYNKQEIFCAYGYLTTDVTEFKSLYSSYLGQKGDIICINSDNKVSPIKIKHGKKSAFPRKNVSILAFTYEGFEYIVLTGGDVVLEIDPEVRPEEPKQVPYYDIYNLIEVYRTLERSDSDKTEPLYEYFVIDKEKIYGTKNLSYKPYLHSYLVIDDSTLKIFGGKGFDGSVDDWLLNVYELELKPKVEEWELKNHLMFNNSHISEQKLNIDDYVAIGDRDRNYFVQNTGNKKSIKIIYRDENLYYCTNFTPEGPNTVNVVASGPPKQADPTISSDSKISDFELASKTIINYLINYGENYELLLEIMNIKINNKDLKWDAAVTEALDKLNIKNPILEKMLNRIKIADDKNTSEETWKLTKNRIMAIKKESDELSQPTLDSQFIDFKIINVINTQKKLERQLRYIQKKQIRVQKEPQSMLIPEQSVNSQSTQYSSTASSRGYNSSNTVTLNINSTTTRNTTRVTYSIPIKPNGSNIPERSVSFNNLVQLSFRAPVTLSQSGGQILYAGSLSKDNYYLKSSTESVSMYGNSYSTASTRSSTFSYGSFYSTKSILQPSKPNELMEIQYEKKNIQNEVLTKAMDSSDEFKKLRTSNYMSEWTFYLNKKASELSASNGNDFIRMKFKIYLKNESHNLSFFGCSNSIYIYRGMIIAYLDSNYKTVDPEVSEQYNCCILYANLEATLTQIKSERKAFGELIFKKKFQLNSQPEITKRCLIMNDKFMLLIGGLNYSRDSEDPKDLRSGILRINLSENPESRKFEEDLNMSLEEKACTYQAVQYELNKDEKLIFVCIRNNPKYLTVLNEAGMIKKKIPLKLDSSLVWEVSIMKVVSGGKDLIVLACEKKGELDDVDTPRFKYVTIDPTNKYTMGEIKLISDSDKIPSVVITDEDTFMMDSTLKGKTHISIRRYDETKICPVFYRVI